MQNAGLIGPNAILQLLPVLDSALGVDVRTRMLKIAGIPRLPDGTHMIPEGDAASLHRVLREDYPEIAPQLERQAGIQTANYILAHRIPYPAQQVLKLLPARVSARLLSQAIARHAWTFAGSGSFHVIDPWTFEIVDNPLIRGEISKTCLCHWHVGVFSRLYQELVAADCTCEETHCAAQGQGQPCRFMLGNG